jgi:glycerol-1-phosphate dehydrogenase [NAD(P)+]
MMELRYDPGQNDLFWEAIRTLPGFPALENSALEEHIPLRQMVFESGALFRLPQIIERAAVKMGTGVERHKSLLVVVDPTPMQRGADSLKPLVVQTLRSAGWEVEILTLEPDGSGQVHTDMAHIETVQARLRPNLAVLSVGSGTVTDISKHACYLYERETGDHPLFVVFQTANSVSAYTSNMAPTLIQGVKRTLDSRYPEALVCDLETLCDAPPEMTVAGVGDMLAAFVSLPDWYLAHVLGMDPGYSPFAQELIGPLDEILLAHAGAIRERTPEGMAVLAKLISLGGLAMSLSHATTPLSGYEHVISHVLDMLNEGRGEPLAQHGSQAALAAVLASAAYQVFLDRFDPASLDPGRCYPGADEMRSRVLQAFGEIDPSGQVAEECWSDYQQKLALWGAQGENLKAFLQDWGGVQAVLRAFTRPPERLAEILRQVGAPLSFDQLTPPIPTGDVKFAFFNAPLMRKRLTLGDVLIFFEWDREALWEQALRSLGA